MPTYVYRRLGPDRRPDGTTFEIAQRITEPALTHDPETGQPVERVISGAGLVFKGSGFYLTDYARKGQEGGEGSAEKKADGDAPAKTDAKSDAKAEAKPEAAPKASSETKAPKADAPAKPAAPAP